MVDTRRQGRRPDRLFESSSRSAISQVQTPAQAKRQLGFSPLSPAEIFEGKGQAPSQHGLLGNLVQGLGRGFGFFGETIAEGVQGVVDPVVGAFQRIGEQAAQGPAQDIARFVVGDLAGSERDQAAMTAAQNSDIAAAEANMDRRINQIQNEIASNFEMKGSLEELIQLQTTPESLAAANALREQLDQSIAMKQGELNSLLIQAEAQAQLFQREIEARFGAEGFLPGATEEQLATIARELDNPHVGGEPGMSLEIMKIVDAIIESNMMNNEEKEERLGFLGEQASMQFELQSAITQLVDDRRALDDLMALPDAELLLQHGVDPQMTSPQLRMDMQFDTFGRSLTALGDAVDPIIEGAFPVGSPQATNAMNVLVGDPNAADDGLLDQIAAGVFSADSDQVFNILLNNVTAGDPQVASQLQAALVTGVEDAGIREQAWNTALDQQVLTPGSYELAAALYQVGAEVLGLPPEDAAAISQDRNLHYLLQVKSQGQVGFAGANQFGIGALTPTAYERVIGPYNEQVAGDAASELAALILYVLEAGGPAGAMQRYLETGVWGS